MAMVSPCSTGSGDRHHRLHRQATRTARRRRRRHGRARVLVQTKTNTQTQDLIIHLVLLQLWLCVWLSVSTEFGGYRENELVHCPSGQTIATAYECQFLYPDFIHTNDQMNTDVLPGALWSDMENKLPTEGCIFLRYKSTNYVFWFEGNTGGSCSNFNKLADVEGTRTVRVIHTYMHTYMHTYILVLHYAIYCTT